MKKGEWRCSFFVTFKNDGLFTCLAIKTARNKALYMSVDVFNTKVLIRDTIFLRLLLETGPPFYVVIRATRRSTRLRGKGSTFIS